MCKGIFTMCCEVGLHIMHETTKHFIKQFSDSIDNCHIISFHCPGLFLPSLKFKDCVSIILITLKE